MFRRAALAIVAAASLLGCKAPSTNPFSDLSSEGGTAMTKSQMDQKMSNGEPIALLDFHQSMKAGLIGIDTYKTIAVSFTGTGWCGPCERMKPVVKNLTKASHGQYLVVIADVQPSNPGAADQLAKARGIRQFPTILLIQGPRATAITLSSKPETDTALQARVSREFTNFHGAE